MLRSRQFAIAGCGGGVKRTNIKQNSFDGSHVKDGYERVYGWRVEARGELHGAGDGGCIGLDIEDRGDSRFVVVV